MNSRLVDATIEHARSMAPRLRALDGAEILAACGLSGPEGLEASVRCSVFRKAWLVDGEVAALFGINTFSLIGNLGHPWFLSTDLILSHRLTFLKGCRKTVQEMLTHYPLLVNYVDARYGSAVRWVKWLGFSVDDPKPYGPQGVLFHRFELRR